jgi:dethiobiotin synthetase
VSRPATLVVVVGTATEVGKTWVGAHLLHAAIGEGMTVAARKPVQSFVPGEITDAELLAAATGETATVVCPADLWLPVPMAPPMAADVLGRAAPTRADLAAAVAWPPNVDLGLVETVGGLYSPMADDTDSIDLVQMLDPDAVVLVADAALGTINACRLAARALAPVVPIIVVNRFDPGDDLHRRNLGWLTDRCGFHAVPVRVGVHWEAQILRQLAPR